MDIYQQSILRVLSTTDSYGPRSWSGQRQKLQGGVPVLGMGRTVYGPQAATVTLRVRDEDLPKLLTGAMATRLAYTSQSYFAYVYHSQGMVKVEFTLPPSRWRVVPLAGLPQHRDQLAVGQQSTGAVARLDWSNPHKAVFGSTQYGKSTFMVDYLIAIAKAYDPAECKIFIANPKNDTKFHPLAHLPHLGQEMVTDYADCERLLWLAQAEALARRGDSQRCQERWVIFVDEAAELVDNRPKAADAIRSLSQIAGGLNINLVAASQSANPSVFGKQGSKAKTNFGTRIIFNLPSSQAYLATDVGGRQYPVENLGRGGKGDCIVVSNGLITRCRAALPSEADYASLPRVETVTPLPQTVIPVSERVIKMPVAGYQETGDALELDYEGKGQRWTVQDLGKALAYALVVSANSDRIRLESGVKMGTGKARAVRDILTEMRKQRLLLKEGVSNA